MHTVSDYYTVLGVPPDASEQEIKEAYRRLAKQYHPDVNRDPGAQDHFIEITGAYEILVDPLKRKDYDALRTTYLRGTPDTQETTWSQPNYTPPTPQQQAPQPSSPPVRNTPMSRFSSPKSRVILFVALLLPLIGGSLGLFFTMQQTALDSAHTVATAQVRANTATAEINASATADTEASSTAIAATATSSASEATATAQVNITATVQANMTATAVTSRNPDPSFSTLIFDDPLIDNSKGYGWDETKCRFAQGAYITSTSGGYSYCLATNTDFSDFVYQVQVKITKGDCGGIIFRLSGSSYDFFLICQDQSYAFFMHNTNTALLSAAASGTSPTIHRGLNQLNFIAIEAQGSSIKLYANHQLLKSVNDNTTTHGQIGVITDDLQGHPTEVAFSNADVWGR
jgi:DnaJ-like protein/3-keto-disaccharide hydrolase